MTRSPVDDYDGLGAFERVILIFIGTASANVARYGQVAKAELVVSPGPNPKGAGVLLTKGRMDKITSADNDLRLGKWQPGQAILV